jgi:capping protein (actin filament) muscle Z-line, beta
MASLATSDEEKLNAAMNIMRRLPPRDTEKNLGYLCELLPDLEDELLQRIDQPLKVAVDEKSNQKYILCDYNRDGDSYRSPWTNNYYPELDDGFLPSDALRKTEQEANRIFEAYMHLYFESGVSSVYLWDIDDGFAGCFLIKKEITEKKRSVQEGCWDSIHVVEVNELGNGSAVYKLTTTVMVSMIVPGEFTGNVDLSGNLTRQAEKTAKYDKVDTHIVHLGRMIEEQETSIRTSMDELYVQKTINIINNIRHVHPQDENKSSPTKAFVADLAGAIKKNAEKRNFTD